MTDRKLKKILKENMLFTEEKSTHISQNSVFRKMNTRYLYNFAKCAACFLLVAVTALACVGIVRFIGPEGERPPVGNGIGSDFSDQTVDFTTDEASTCVPFDPTNPIFVLNIAVSDEFQLGDFINVTGDTISDRFTLIKHLVEESCGVSINLVYVSGSNFKQSVEDIEAESGINFDLYLAELDDLKSMEDIVTPSELDFTSRFYPEAISNDTQATYIYSAFLEPVLSSAELLFINEKLVPAEPLKNMYADVIKNPEIWNLEYFNVFCKTITNADPTLAPKCKITTDVAEFEAGAALFYCGTVNELRKTSSVSAMMPVPTQTGSTVLVYENQLCMALSANSSNPSAADYFIKAYFEHELGDDSLKAYARRYYTFEESRDMIYIIAKKLTFRE